MDRRAVDGTILALAGLALFGPEKYLEGYWSAIRPKVATGIYQIQERANTTTVFVSGDDERLKTYILWIGGTLIVAALLWAVRREINAADD